MSGSVGRGPLLDEPDGKKVAQAVARLVEAQKGWHGYNCAVWARNRAWRKGRRGVRIVEDTDTNTYDVKLPAGSAQMAPTPNNLDKLIRRVVATLTVDPPRAEVSPETGEDRDRDAAEFAERLLQNDGDRDLKVLRTVADLAGTYASGFVHYYLHPTKGGRVPVEIMAHPNATQLAVDPMDPEAEPDPASALNDPMTGMPDPSGLMVVKYLADDGVTLLETPAGAKMRWQPEVCAEIVSGKTVWFLPVNATDVSDTQGMVIGYVTTLGELESQYPEIADWSQRRKEALVEWRPSNAKRWVHPMMESAMKAAVKDGTVIRNSKGEVAPESPVFCYRLYYEAHGAYPEGAVVVTSGDELLYRDGWSAEVEGVKETLMIPVAQFRWRDDANDQSPYGIAGAEELGPAEEMRAAQMAALTEYLFRFNHPNVYLPIGSPVQPAQLARRDGTPIPVNMDGSGRPIYEDIPQFPQPALMMYDRLGQEMESAIGLEQAAQGVASPSVTSGRHAQQIIEQALVALANQVQNLSDCYVRMCRIKLQMWRAFYDTPRLLQIVAEGGEYKLRRWQGTDLVGVRDVRIAKGSLTMLSPERKQQMAMQELEVARANGDPMAYATYRTVTGSTIQPMLGIADDEHRMRVERQIAAWWEGPSEETEAQEQQYAMQAQQASMQYQQMLQMGQIPPGPDGQPAPMEQVMGLGPSPMATAAAQLFAPSPVDGEPAAAQIRWLALRDELAKQRFVAMPGPWQQAMVQAYETARKAAGIQTAEEQAQAAQAAQQAQQQAEAQKQQADLQHKTQLKQLDIQADMAKATQKNDLQAQREQMQFAVRSAMDLNNPSQA